MLPRSIIRSCATGLQIFENPETLWICTPVRSEELLRTRQCGGASRSPISEPIAGLFTEAKASGGLNGLDR